jgi:hypothetical protein
VHPTKEHKPAKPVLREAGLAPQLTIVSELREPLAPESQWAQPTGRSLAVPQQGIQASRSAPARVRLELVEREGRASPLAQPTEPPSELREPELPE